jgi:hypothetical protein
LGFNTTERQNPIWYGKVFASGSAFVRGRPGFVNLDINVAASPSSSFTFTLSDQQEASDNSPAVHRRQRVQEAKMIRGVPDFRQGRCQFKAPGHGFPPAPHIYILLMSIDG